MSYNPNNPRPISTQTTLAFSNYSQKQRVPISFPPNSPYTKQEFKNECDINILMAQYMATGQLPNINERAPQYLDVTGIEYQDSMNFIAGAQTLFNELPSQIRSRFENDPGKFLDFTSNPNNREEMAQMGLLKPKSEWVIPYPSSSPKGDVTPSQDATGAIPQSSTNSNAPS
ncbi:MAG: internal scaffolding protein [Microvirus sp.]|nr:MAG: internal scaffolding protein [Microvirus sp.]